MKATRLLLPVLLLSACENPVKRAVRDATYSGYEMIGVQKRDLLKRDIARTREDQKEAGESLENALEKLRRLYAVPESELSGQYREVKSAYERADAKTKDVRVSHEKMQTVARDLFREWESEIGEIQTPELKSKSRAKLEASRAKFAELDRSLDAAEAKINPVLVKLKDHVLYLKHNLNAESLASLKTERDRIGREIDGLLRELKNAVARAESFSKTLD